MADLEQLVLSISADTRQMQRALQKLVGDTQQAADSVDKAFSSAAPKVDKVSQSLGKTRAETANLAAQFQDIAVQLQGGQSPFTVALQQGTQISQVIGQQGAAGAVSLLGGAFSSLLSPVALVTIATIALGGAAVQYATKAMGGIGDLDDKLKAHAELIKSLKDAYGDAGKGIDTAVKESISVLSTLLNLSTDSLQKQFRNLTNSFLSSVTVYNQLGDAAGQFTEENNPRYKAFGDAINALRQQFTEGTPDIRAFREAVSQIVDSSTDQNVRKVGQELLDMSKNAGGAEDAIQSTSKALRQLSADARAAAEQGEAFSKAMKELGGTVSPDLTDRQKIMQNYAKALEAAGSTEERLAASRAKDDQLSVLSANERKKAAEDASKEAESAQKRFDSALNSTARQTATMTGAAQAIGLGAGALTQFETQARLTETAQQSLGKVTDDTAKKIQAQAAAAGVAADALAKAKAASQIEFNSKTAFLSDEDVKIAQQLSSIYGNNVPAALNSSYAAAITLNDAFKGISSSLSNDLTSGLTDVASGSKSVKDGFSDMASSIIKDIEQIVIKLAIVGPLMRSLQTGFNALGIGDLFGTSSASGYNAAVSAGSYAIPKAGINFDVGGYTGPGGKNQPAGIVHKGEVVWSQRDVARAGGVGMVEGMRLRGYADGGVVAPSLPSVPRGPAAPTNNIYIQGAQSQPSMSTKPNSSGGQDISIVFRDMVRSVVNGDLSAGTGLAKSFKQFSTAGTFRGS